MFNLTDYLELYADTFLSRRVLNALIRVDIFTVKDFINHFSTQYTLKIHSLHHIWSESINKILTFIELLKNDGYILSDEMPLNLQIIWEWQLDIDSKYLNMSLTAFSSILSLRTINALRKIDINTVNELLSKHAYVLNKSIDWLWKKWYSEISKLIKNIKSMENTTNSPSNKEISISSVFEDNRIIGILKYNLITNIKQLWPFVKWESEWSDLRYLKEDDIGTLIEIYSKYYLDEKKEGVIADFFMNHFSDTDKKIISERILWDLSLEQMWKKLNLTKERIRQKQKELENRIADLWRSIITDNQELYVSILKIISDYEYILLPKQTYLFNFLWFEKEDYHLLFLILKWVNGIKGEYLEKNHLYVLFSNKINISGDDLRSMYSFYMRKLLKNNEDISLEDTFYEYLLDDDKASTNNMTNKGKVVRWSNKKNESEHISSTLESSVDDIAYAWGDGGVYELIL